MDDLVFIALPLRVIRAKAGNVFAAKNDKSVAETLTGRKYRTLTREVTQHHADALQMPLGEFLAGLKATGNPLYRKFLNGYGDLEYLAFEPEFGIYAKSRGLYRYKLGGEVKYIGSATTTFRQRLRQGYGDISPKNCYRDGQSTNCLLNALITLYWEQITFEICPLNDDDSEILRLEEQLIRQSDPEWNHTYTTHKRKGIMQHFAQWDESGLAPMTAPSPQGGPA